MNDYLLASINPEAIMRPFLLATVLCIAPLTANAATYGLNGGCERLQGEPINDSDLFFDGVKIGGQDWWCTIDGKCESDGGPYLSVFTVIEGADTATISFKDDGTYVLQRCPE